MRSHRHSIAFPQPTAKWLKAESKKMGITVSTLVARIVDSARMVREQYPATYTWSVPQILSVGSQDKRPE